MHSTRRYIHASTRPIAHAHAANAPAPQSAGARRARVARGTAKIVTPRDPVAEAQAADALSAEAWDALVADLELAPDEGDGLSAAATAEIDEAGGFSVEPRHAGSETMIEERGPEFDAFFDQPDAEQLAHAAPAEGWDEDGETWFEELMVEAAESGGEPRRDPEDDAHIELTEAPGNDGPDA